MSSAAPRAFALAALTLLALPTHAQTAPPGARIVHFSSGTGFFVNTDGYVLTNHHVVQNCRDVRLEGAVSGARARVLATDAQNDLALLKTETPPPAAGETAKL